MEHITFFLLLLLFLLSLFFLCRAEGPPKCKEKVVAAGGKVQLLPDKIPREKEKVAWRVRLDTGQKLWILKVENKTSKTKGGSPFYRRIAFQREGLYLWIRPVRLTDSGLYWAEFEGKTGNVTSLYFCVSVWEPLVQPLLETRILHREQDRCDLSLLCTVPGATNVSYSWSCTGGQPGVLGHQPQLDLQLLGDSDPMVCLCNATNPVSWTTATTDVTASCFSTGPGSSWSYCSVKGMLCLLVLGSLGMAVAITHLLVRQRGPPSHGDGTGWGPPKEGAP